MQTHNLQPKTKNKTKKTVGRGGTRGKTSGRGHKGQNARSGNSGRPAIRDVIKKIPKLRGYRFNSFQIKPQVVNVAELAGAFSAGDEVTPKALVQKGLIDSKKGIKLTAKILGNGEIAIALSITGCELSGTARDKITAAGGTVNQ